MSKYLAVIAACACALPAAVTVRAAPPNTEQNPAPAATAPQSTPYREQMQARMRLMQEQMNRIHGTTDPAERQKLLQEHMRTMQAQMQAMRALGGGMMGGGMMSGRTMGRGMGGAGTRGGTGAGGMAGPGMGGMMRNLTPEQRQQWMQDRMDMMQMMMQQMIDQMQVQQGTRPPASSK